VGLLRGFGPNFYIKLYYHSVKLYFGSDFGRVRFFFSVVDLTRLNGFCQFEDEIFHLIYFPSFPNPSILTNSLSLLVVCSFCLFVFFFFSLEI
jgi:hypothetical protein